MSEIIQKITIKGFKSIRDLEDFPLGAINVLIGANGVGKSNFISLFRMLRELVEQRLQLFLAEEGGADSFLYLGPRETEELTVQFLFGQNGYRFRLRPTVDNRFVFAEEASLYNGHLVKGTKDRLLGPGHFEARLKDHREDSGLTTERGIFHYVYKAISRWVVYHFHDTSRVAGVRRAGAINDNLVLQASADNLAAFLYRIQNTHPGNYQQIRDVVRLAAPFFDDFQLRPIPATPDKIQLEWRQRGSDRPFLAHQLSDGTLRFICLATALLQPDPPATMLFDEPELGLHPYALNLLGGLIHKIIEPLAPVSRQIILSTQSALLLNEFDPENIVVVERNDGQSVFRRLGRSALSEWLNDYSLGELWQKDLLGGRPIMDRSKAMMVEETK